MRGAAAIAAALLTAGPGTGLAQSDAPWLRIGEGRLAVQPGATVEVCGTGHLEFVDGRKGIAVGTAEVRVDGGGEAVWADVPVEVRGPGIGHWLVRRAAGFPAIDGTTIRDTEDRGSAAVDAADPTRFWLRVDAAGEAVFFQPEAGPADCGFRDAPAPGDVSGSTDSDTARRIDRALARFADYGFSGAILVAREDGETILAAGYGLADRERAVPDRAATLFELGSLTKQFTAAAILRLAERGVLTVEDSLGGTWDLRPPIAGITLHQLLSHTSGLPEDFPVAPASRAAVVNRLRDLELEFAPGEGFRYSNLGYVVLAALIEEKTGAAYRDVLDELFFDPLGLDRIEVWREGLWPDSLVAIGYSGTFGSGQALDPHPVRPAGWDLLGASGVVGSLPELHRWIVALRGGAVLDEASLQRMFTPVHGEFGYGWLMYETDRGTPGIIHGGDTEGVQSYAAVFPDEDLVVLIAVNDRRGWRGPVFDTVVDLALGREVPPLPPPTVAVDAPELESWSGTYRLPGGRIDVHPTDEGLLLGAEGQAAVSLVTSPRAEERAELEIRNAAAEAFMTALTAGDSAAVRETLAESGRHDAFFDVVWSALTEGHGQLAGYEVLGTAPDRAGREITFVRLRFPDGEETLRLVWRPHLDGWGTGGERPRREFRPVGPDTFATYDLFGARTIRIRFRETDGGPAIEFLDAPEAPLARDG
jgi:CubicO group peptidase (beta-lactamase class C family)